MDIESVRRIAWRHNWEEVQINTRSCVVGFKRQNERINVYYTTGTVGSCLTHPRHGKTQLFRRNQTLSNLGQIMRDLRWHSGETQAPACPPAFPHADRRATQCDKE